MSSVKNYILNLNFFKPSADSGEQENEEQRRANIIATRVYLILLLVSFVVLTAILCSDRQTTTVTFENPTKNQFETLPLDALCPCSRISLPYGEFVSLQVSFHQVCTSDFVSERWIEALFSGSNSTYFHSQDFRTYGSALFQGLASFCRLSKASVLQSIDSFKMSTLLSPQVLSETVLQSQTQAFIKQFQLTAPSSFGARLQLMRKMTSAKRLLSGLQIGAIPLYVLDYEDHFSAYLLKLFYRRHDGSLCDCTFNIDCKLPSIIVNEFGQPTQLTQSDNFTLLMMIPGILLGCLPIDSILLSTLECFYNQTCVDDLISFFPTNEKFIAMKTVEGSRFELYLSVKSVVDQLMVEEWMTNISHEKYFTQCAPRSCTCIRKKRHSFEFVFVQLIGQLGGLTALLGLFIPILIRFLRRPRNTEPTPRTPGK